MADLRSRLPYLPVELINALETEVEEGDPPLNAGSSPLTGYVIVESKDDFPTPAGGIIQLEDNTVYQVNGSIVLGTDRLLVGSGTIVSGRHSSRDQLIYTGTDALLQALGGDDFRMQDLTVVALAGAVIDAVDAANVSINRVVGTALRVGRCEDCNFVVIQQVGLVNVESGLEIVNSSTGELFAVLNSRFTQKLGGAGTLLDLGTSVWTSFQLAEIQLDSALAGTDISGLTASGNLAPVTGRGRVLNSIINGLGTHLVNITVDDVQ